MLRMNWLEISELSSDSRYRNCEPTTRLTQEQTFHAAGLDVMYYLFELHHNREEIFWTQPETLFLAIALIRYAAWNYR